MAKAKYTEFAPIFTEAHDAGMKAAEAHMPTPMQVVQRADPLNDNSPIVKRYAPVIGGVCGFGWINIYPGNCRAANAAKKLAKASKAYHGGVQIWVGQFNQSYELKTTYAAAYAAVLQEKLPALDTRFKGAYSGGRLD